METVVVTRPMQWAPIPDISAVPPLSERDRECFRELRDVLERHGCLGRFGVNLIHKHFEVADDEVLVETIDTESRTLTVRAMPKAEMPEAIETQWQLASGEALQICHGYCVYNSGHSRFHSQV
jgi:hypothetical protein